MQTPEGQFHPTRFADLAVTVDFHCDSACRFCIVQEGMNRFRGVPFPRFQEIVADNLVDRKYGRVIFTGGEVTLERSLRQFIDHAAQSGGFKHLRLQTNGRRLADADFARELADAGVDEFFVSLHGDSAEVHDWITQRPGSFDELVRGLDNLAALDVRVITNTVMIPRNLPVLAGIVDIAARHGASRMEFWNYLPMEDHVDERGLIAPMTELVPALRTALAACRDAGVEGVTKYVPRCLLDEDGEALDDSQPDVIIVEEFWDQFPKFNCLYEAVCAHSDSCLGLHHPYVNKFGWEESALAPTPRTTPWVERTAPQEGRPEVYAGEDVEQPDRYPAWSALIDGLAGAGRITGIQLTRNQARYGVALDAGGRVDIVLAARDDTARALARTRSFNVFYTNAETVADRAAFEALLTDFVRLIDERDDGALTLDPRKGLLVPLRRKRGGGKTV